MSAVGCLLEGPCVRGAPAERSCSLFQVWVCWCHCPTAPAPWSTALCHSQSWCDCSAVSLVLRWMSYGSVSDYVPNRRGAVWLAVDSGKSIRHSYVLQKWIEGKSWWYEGSFVSFRVPWRIVFLLGRKSSWWIVENQIFKHLFIFKWIFLNVQASTCLI